MSQGLGSFPPQQPFGVGTIMGIECSTRTCEWIPQQQRAPQSGAAIKPDEKRLTHNRTATAMRADFDAHVRIFTDGPFMQRTIAHTTLCGQSKQCLRITQ